MNVAFSCGNRDIFYSVALANQRSVTIMVNLVVFLVALFY